MKRSFLVVSILYAILVFLYICSVEVQNLSLVYADFIPAPHFEKNTPEAFKRLFFTISRDGENVVLPSTNNNVILHGPQDKKVIALTFDADMTPWMKEQLLSGNVQSYYNQKLIDYLNQTHTKATLFLTGMWIELYPEVAKELAANPLFELGNHSYSHPSFAGYCYGLAHILPADKEQEIDKTQQLLYMLTNHKNTLFRFPGGCYSSEDLALLHTKGLQAIQWDVVGDDGFNNNTLAIESNVLNNIHNGSIIVMHMNGFPNDPKTADALPDIISVLKQQGYTFVTISELLSQNEDKKISYANIQLVSQYLLFQEKVE